MPTAPEARLVVVDDEIHVCDIVRESLQSKRYAVVTFTDPAKAVEYLQNNAVDLVLSDLMMGDRSGIEILSETLRVHRDAVVILMTAHPTVPTVISALKSGAYDFLVKPFKLEVLKATIKRGLAHQKLARENLTLKGQVEFLKTAGAFTMGVDIDPYLRMVVSACKSELGAAAAAIMEIDPAKREPIRLFHESDESAYTPLVTDPTHLEQFTFSRNSEPRLTTEQMTLNGQSMVKTFISCPIFIRRTLHGVINLLVVDRFERIYQAQMSVLSILTNSAASAIANQILYQDLQSSYLQAIRALANAIEARDQHTAGHTDRVIKLAETMARYMGWDSFRIGSLIMGCTLHDIGKIGVPDSILNKNSVLTEEERLQMINHPLVGLKIISGVDLFKPSIPYIISHHERFDGAGYPRGLKGEEIPIEGRLLAVVDTFDAILSDRPYRKGATLAVALSELVTNKGRQFDPEIVDVFLSMLKDGRINFREIYQRDEDISVLDQYLVTETVSV